MLLDPGPVGVQKRIIRLPPAGEEKLSALNTNPDVHRAIGPLERAIRGLDEDKKKVGDPAGM